MNFRRLSRQYWGSFFACLVVCIAIITAFPITVTWLPDIVMGKSALRYHWSAMPALPI